MGRDGDEGAAKNGCDRDTEGDEGDEGTAKNGYDRDTEGDYF